MHVVEHRTTTPLWPAANGEVERQNRFLLKCLQIAHLEKKNWRSELISWLTAYKSTPQVTTGATPFSLMFGQEIRSKLPELRRETVDVSKEATRDTDWSNKLKGKNYADEQRRAMPRSLRVGDAVLLKAEKTNKLPNNFCPSPFKIVQKTGSEVTVRNENGVELERSSALVEKYNEQESASVDAGPSNAHQGEIQESTNTETGKGEDECEPQVPGACQKECEPQVPGVCQKTLRRSTRQVHRPSRFKDFV